MPTTGSPWSRAWRPWRPSHMSSWPRQCCWRYVERRPVNARRPSRGCGRRQRASLGRPLLAETTHRRSLLEHRIERGTVAPAFAVDLLERMSGPSAAGNEARRALIDPLTERERTVLRYLATTLPNAAIAAELYVS